MKRLTKSSDVGRSNMCSLTCRLASRAGRWSHSASPEQSESKYRRRGASLFFIQDATIATCYAQVGAMAQTLASCWVSAFDEAGVAAALRASA